jgi:hypothetical protein
MSLGVSVQTTKFATCTTASGLNRKEVRNLPLRVASFDYGSIKQKIQLNN